MGENKLPDFSVVRLSGMQAIKEAKKLDDKAFEGHQKISKNELRSIADQGGLFGIVYKQKMVAEAQLLFRSTLFYNLEYESSAYCYGIAVDEKFRGKGLAHLLIARMEKEVRNNSLKALYLACRPENYASLKLWNSLEYKVCAYKDRYFGPDTIAHTRLLLYKNISEKNTRSNLHITSLPLKNDECDIDLRNNIANLLAKHGEIIIRIKSADKRLVYEIYKTQ
ncbi:putative acetyltransferase [Salinivirga cyanobacteriivorans]|uniref:Putative acetyltransferase n=1 Tax=Salinivirga cyanobacteriivorans TaxID=1307839 RepID=A0A0S2I200_9BACT|nr:GNAT family N-acetyltransferase [Salinivirga cyanobacteriivorans]ALO16306.1 putative acetyltransferase [Salinivirga cyanobacteriivorans]